MESNNKRIAKNTMMLYFRMLLMIIKFYNLEVERYNLSGILQFSKNKLPRNRADEV